jgi:hypothetical protein
MPDLVRRVSLNALTALEDKMNNAAKLNDAIEIRIAQSLADNERHRYAIVPRRAQTDERTSDLRLPVHSR